MRKTKFQIATTLTAALILSSPFSAPAQQPLVEKLVLADTIQSVSAGKLDRALARAYADGAQALLIELNTPGGLLTSMRSMVGAILGARIPVIIYVSPAGARAGSAGFYLLEAADIAAMAPGTNAGAAHVVSLIGKPDDTEMQKIENDAEALLRSCVTRRNRRRSNLALLHRGRSPRQAPHRHHRHQRRATAHRARRPHHHAPRRHKARAPSLRRAH